MRQVTIKHKGKVCLSSVKVPGWGGELTKEQFQPWHMDQFIQAASVGIELLYPYEDITINKKCVAPFVPLSKMYYQLNLDLFIETPPEHNLLVVPHYRYYTDPKWSTPLPVACSWGTFWWPKSLSIIFRYGPKPTIFKKNEPFAQAVSLEKQEYCLLEELEIKSIDENKYITRKWTMACGTVQDNLYNVLAALERNNKLPCRKMRKFRVL